MTTNYTHEFKNGLVLTRMELVEGAAVPERAAKHNIWIYDRSGSMYHLIGQVIKDLEHFADELEPGDTLSIAYFSSESGMFRYILKGHVIGDGTSEMVKNMLAQNNYTLALTCFSEVLEETTSVIADLDAMGLSDSYALMFFTDGYPVVSNYKREIERIFKAIEALSAKLSYVLLVGYGDYYNRELMKDMAIAFGGTLVHSSRLEEFEEHMMLFLDGAIGLPRVAVPVELPDPIAAFTVSGKRITQFAVVDGCVRVPADTRVLYILSQGYGSEPRQAGVDDGDLYAAAYVLLQNMQADLALQVLGEIGDVYLIDKVAGAWTNADYGVAAGAVLNAVAEGAARYRAGKNTSYLPDPNAFCLLDAFELLMADEKAYFYPRHPSFHYKKIGVPSIPREGYPKFVSEPDPASPFSELVWNEDRLNLSVRAVIKGTVDLPEGHEVVSLSSPYPCIVYRNYTIIKDGVLNVTSMPISMSQETHRKLYEAGMIDDPIWNNDQEIFDVNFSAVPLINMAIASGDVLAADLCEAQTNIYRTGAIMKVLKHMRDRIDPNKEIKTDESLTPEQERFLEAIGLRRGVFSPPVDKGDSTDVYYAKEFKITARGFSSLPKIEDVEAKLLDGKKLTQAQQFIAEGLDWFDANQPGGSVEETVKWIDQTVRDFRKVQARERGKIQRAKFGIILNKKWFPDLTSRDGAQLSVGDLLFTFNIKDVEVAY